jgi:hypothetical protein
MIYILDNNRILSAQYLDDLSLYRIIEDIAQVLCNVHAWCEFHKTEGKALKDKKIPLMPKDADNKWSQWTRECRANYNWMVEYGLESSNEFTWRKHSSQMLEPEFHKSHSVIQWARDNIPDLPINHKYEDQCTFEDNEPTLLPLVMPKRYHNFRSKYCSGSLIIDTYRNYYHKKLKNKKCKENCENGKITKEGIFGYFTCKVCNGHGYMRQKWTRRQKPEWLIL